MSGLSASDGKETSHRHSSLSLRQVRVEGLDSSADTVWTLRFVPEIPFTFVAGILTAMKSSPQASPGYPLLFEDDTRNSKQEVMWNVMCSIEPSLGFKPEPPAKTL
jgi:hypothetical protein